MESPRISKADKNLIVLILVVFYEIVYFSIYIPHLMGQFSADEYLFLIWAYFFSASVTFIIGIIFLNDPDTRWY